jgi:hypothetical protein
LSRAAAAWAVGLSSVVRLLIMRAMLGHSRHIADRRTKCERSASWKAWEYT